jgi:hypothetical protein
LLDKELWKSNLHSLLLPFVKNTCLGIKFYVLRISFRAIWELLVLKKGKYFYRLIFKVTRAEERIRKQGNGV